MNKDAFDLTELYRLILPEEIIEYFKVISVKTIDKEVHIYLDEKGIPPEGYTKSKLLSKGFHKISTIQDYPIRDKACYLHVRRRRWLVKDTGQVISRDWNVVAKGTHLTNGFATFLKGIFR